jgi:spermidine/putrescine transport system permease protein
MVAGYTPGVPVLGTVSTIGASLILLGGYALILIRGRKRELAGAVAGKQELAAEIAG